MLILQREVKIIWAEVVVTHFRGLPTVDDVIKYAKACFRCEDIAECKDRVYKPKDLVLESPWFNKQFRSFNWWGYVYLAHAGQEEPRLFKCREIDPSEDLRSYGEIL